MAVNFGLVQNGVVHLRDGGQSIAPVSEARGLLDFGLVMKHRGLLDAQALTAPAAASAAIPFDEGSLFGHATSVYSESEMQLYSAATDVRPGKKNALDTGNNLRVDAEVHGSRECAPGTTKQVVSEPLASVRFGDPVSDMRFPSGLAANIAGFSSHTMAGGKDTGKAASSGAILAARAPHVTPSFVYLAASKGSDGVELTVRAAGVAGAQADELERRLRQTAAEDGTNVTVIRLNGTNRPDGARRSRGG